MRNLLYLSAVVVLFSACKGGLPFAKKKFDKSGVTGWNYNDKNMGGFFKSPVKEQGTGPGLVLYKVVHLPWELPMRMSWEIGTTFPEE